MQDIKAVILTICGFLAFNACSDPTQVPGSKGKEDAPLIYVMRHVDKAASEEARVPAPAGYDPAECEMDTGLSRAGVDRAAKVANDLAEVKFVASYSSNLCRTAHTAHIASGLSPSTSLTDPNEDRAAFIAGMTEEARQAGGPILLVMHSNWIGALFSEESELIAAPSWAAPQCYGDVRAFRLDDERWIYVGSHFKSVTDLKYFTCEDGHTG